MQYFQHIDKPTWFLATSRTTRATTKKNRFVSNLWLINLSFTWNIIASTPLSHGARCAYWTPSRDGAVAYSVCTIAQSRTMTCTPAPLDSRQIFCWRWDWIIESMKKEIEGEREKDLKCQMMWLDMVHVAWWGGFSSATLSLNGGKLMVGTKMKKIKFYKDEKTHKIEKDQNDKWVYCRD